MGDWRGRHEYVDDIDDEAEPPAGLPAPWERPDYAAEAEDGPARARHDAFTASRRAAFLRRLAKHGCIKDAARKTGVATRTVYNHQDKDPVFAGHCGAALRMAAGSLELTAWERAVEGVDQLFACGGEVHVRKRYSDGLLRLLLQAANPKKYGARPGFTRKRLLAWERERIEREVRAEWREKRPSSEDVDEAILRNLAAVRRRHQRASLSDGDDLSLSGEEDPPIP